MSNVNATKSSITGLTKLRQIMSDLGCTRLYVKPLALNDDSKKQVYLGSGFESLNLLPFRLVEATERTGRPEFYGKLDWHWIADDGTSCAAPGAQLILYPQYPEVRLSGFLRGCALAPGKPMAYGAGRTIKDRLLFIGVHPSGKVFAHLAWDGQPLVAEFKALSGLEQIGVFYEVPLAAQGDSRLTLLAKLRSVHQKGWIEAARLYTSGGAVLRGQCKGTNCGGYTLEAELDISPNGYSEPDYLGWEVKQHAVVNFVTLSSGPITLFTPEPQQGYYKTNGAIEFVKKFGYIDRMGREDRMNFGGVFKAGVRHALTGITLKVEGYDPTARKITDSAGGILLVSDQGEIAAKWPFSHLLAHWNRKHAKAVYVPSMHQQAGTMHSYHYGPKVRLGQQTDFLWFLGAMASGFVYLDPAVKVENLSSQPKLKCRNQFRIRSVDIPRLYRSVDVCDLVTGEVTTAPAPA